MKKRYILELLLISVTLIGFILKLFHIAGSNILIASGLLFLSVLYFIGGYFILNDVKLSFKKSEHLHLSAKRIMYSVAFGMAFGTLVIGFLFKLMLWRGADTQIASGLVLTMIAMLFLMLYIQFKKLDVGSVKQILLRGSLGIIIGLLLLNTTQSSIASLYYRDMPEYRDAMIRTIENPEDPEAFEELKKLREQRNGSYVKPRPNN